MSGQDFPHHLTVDIGQSEVAARVAVRQTLVIQAQNVQNGRVQIVHVHGIVDRQETELVRNG